MPGRAQCCLAQRPDTGQCADKDVVNILASRRARVHELRSGKIGRQPCTPLFANRATGRLGDHLASALATMLSQGGKRMPDRLLLVSAKSPHALHGPALTRVPMRRAATHTVTGSRACRAFLY